MKKPTLALRSNGWAYKLDWSYLDLAGVVPCIIYVGPFRTAHDAYRRALQHVR